MHRLGILLLAAPLVLATSTGCGGGGQPAAPSATAGAPAVRSTAFSDPFDAYDSSTWEKANWANGNPFNCGFLPDHVTFANGTMTLRLDQTASSGKSYSGGEYRTIDTFSYGRFETRMKAAKGSGIVSSFFTYTGSPWDEIDVEILGKNTTQVQFNYYVNGTGGHERVVDLGFDASASAHTYAFEWEPGAIRWYVDGALKHSVTGSASTLPSHPMQIMMNLWNGIGVDGWLGPFSYSGPLYASYDSVAYTPAGTSGYPLTVTRSGAGGGTVTSSPGGIACGSTCSASFAGGTSVTLTASPASGSRFAGWSGACAGANATCTVSMSAARSVTATFESNGGDGTCKTISGGQSGSFGTTGAACFTVNGNVNGWGCSSTDGRTVTVNGTQVTCGRMPLPGGAPYTFSFSAGTYPWATMYWW